MSYILTLDIGTTSVKTSLYTEQLKLVGYVSEEYKLITKPNNVIELPAEKYWEASKTGIKRIIEKSGVSGNKIQAIVITTQGETLIPVNSQGEALRNAIVWLDGRATEESKYLSQKFPSEQVYSITGLPGIDSVCPISKILWIKKYEPEVYKKTYKFLLLEDFIIMKLCGEFVTEKSLLSSTGYFDIINDRIWSEILDYAGISTEKLPEPLECGTKVGCVNPEVAKELKLSEKTIVITGAMDQVAGAVGAGNLKPGIVTETTGTALVIAATTTKPPQKEDTFKVTTYRHAIKGKYLIIPICMTAGIILKWFKDEFCHKEVELSKETGRSVYDLLGEMAEKIPPLSNGLFLLPYFRGMLTPEENYSARGTFFGISLNTSKAHFIRSIFEGVGYMLRENLEVMRNLGTTITQIRALGGSARSKLWLHIKADITDCEVVSMQEPESSSLGAAILGSVALGLFTNYEQAASKSNLIKERFYPEKQNVNKYERGYLLYKELYQQLKPLFLLREEITKIV